MNLSSWSIRKPVPTIVGFLVLVLSGLLSFTQLGIDDTPNIDIPAVMVTVTQPGAGPTELETQVTKKVEDAVAALDNVEDVNSTVKDSVSTTTVSFLLGSDTDRATNDVRNAISQIRQDLPLDVNDPVIQRLNFSGGSIMTYAVVSEQRSVEELSNLVDRVISRELLMVEGVARIDRVGGLDREIRVNLNPDRLLALGITATEVNDQIRALNADLPAGQSEVAGSDRNIRALGSASTVQGLASYRIVLPNGEDVLLSSLGTVEDSFAELKQIARFTVNDSPEESLAEESSPENRGNEVVAFSIFRSTGASLVSVEEAVQAAIPQLQETLPSDVQLQLIFSRGFDTRESYQATIDALILGSILTVIVVGFFLRDWRPTLITAVALPLSIIPTFTMMNVLGYTLNGMTLLALALAMGNLVDDAICMIENIDQHLRMGKPPFQASLDAAKEIGLAVIATTATIVGIFVPVAFMGGVPGQFFQPFGFTVAIATMFSTLVAVTMTPMLAAALLKPKSRPVISSISSRPVDPTPKRRIQPYRRLLTWALRHRLLTLAIAAILFIGSLQLVPLIPKGLFAGSDRGISTMKVELPPGATLQQTDRTVQQVADTLLQDPNVVSIFSRVGDGSSEINTAQLVINLKPREQRDVSRLEFEAQSRGAMQTIPGARISFESQGPGGSGKDLSLILQSENPQALSQTVNDLEQQMRQIPGLVEVGSSASLVKPEILIHPDPARAADLGVSVQSIARTLYLAAIGDTESNLAKFDLPDRQIPIRVQIDPDRRNNLDTLKNLQIPSRNGSLVPLKAVADIRFGSGPAQLSRFNRSRQITVGANLQGVSLGDAYAQVQALPVMQNMPPDVRQQPDGDTEIMRDVFARFLAALGTGILCIYAVLVLLYNSFLIPWTILTALPLSIGGALLALMITQKELGLFALIGIVLLMGLVTKNAILLVDSAMANQREGLSQFRAVVESGVTRLRPILMTTFSTIAGMMPIALELGADAQTRSPMAIAVIGGFTTSTLLTLVVVPVIFTYIDTFQFRLLRPFRKRFQGVPAMANGSRSAMENRAADLPVQR
ncbi:MAG: efflux RND transporter permease subunit [Leptolyngbyaceae cyanobacterium MO_188.B28]|nr:efflux RND transporter permease subunit [Leptolyngbyaceae cyanobacterium MO_188.B28]